MNALPHQQTGLTPANQSPLTTVPSLHRGNIMSPPINAPTSVRLEGSVIDTCSSTDGRLSGKLIQLLVPS